MDEHHRRLLCRLVAGIVVTDNDLDPKESEFIDRMLLAFGIPVEERDVIFPIVATSEAVESIQQLPVESHAQALALLVEAATADGKIVPDELEYLRAVARAMGVDMRDLGRLVAKYLP